MVKSVTYEDLKSVAFEKYIHFTTSGRKTGKSHTVELWFAVGGDRVYLSHEGEETDWMKNIKKNGRVKFEIGGRRFIGTARLLEDHTEEAWTAEVALYEKYYGKALKEVVEDWFSLSKLVAVELA
jgi:deazaflavin-dependent oxidoreductase (nitroreductase family)